ncbi:BnaA01g22370D [Brassica napus]|uniref:BnaA01g22370D protein n=1 Tax=Brassica napus TaxID=3708 RepID=A0A078GIY0_BRANA|nr:BnaA01g22370D [Brassica napus]
MSYVFVNYPRGRCREDVRGVSVGGKQEGEAEKSIKVLKESKDAVAAIVDQ